MWLVLAALVGTAAAGLDVYEAQGMNMSLVGSWDCTQGLFGASLSPSGFTGRVAIADPIEACTPIARVPFNDTAFALIRRGPASPDNNCSFGLKVFHAQMAGFAGAIIYDYESDAPLVMMEYDGPLNINISSVFVSSDAGARIKLWVEDAEIDGIAIWATMYPDVLVRPFLFTFVTIVAGISIVFTLFLFYRRHTVVVQSRPKVRLSPAQALKLAKRPFVEGDKDETCCICLEPYAQGDTITTLRCKHEFHHDCIKPWLQEQQRVCPICKRDPFGPDEPLSERSPLLSPPPTSEIDESHVELGRPESSSASRIDAAECTEATSDVAPTAESTAADSHAETDTAAGTTISTSNHYESEPIADDHASINGLQPSLSSHSSASSL